VAGAWQGLYPELSHVKKDSAKIGIEGGAWYRWQVMGLHHQYLPQIISPCRTRAMFFSKHMVSQGRWFRLGIPAEGGSGELQMEKLTWT